MYGGKGESDGEEGCGLDWVAVETESSIGHCEVRSLILDADCSCCGVSHSRAVYAAS